MPVENVLVLKRAPRAFYTTMLLQIANLLISASLKRYLIRRDRFPQTLRELVLTLVGLVIIRVEISRISTLPVEFQFSARGLCGEPIVAFAKRAS